MHASSSRLLSPIYIHTHRSRFFSLLSVHTCFPTPSLLYTRSRSHPGTSSSHSSTDTSFTIPPPSCSPSPSAYSAHLAPCAPPRRQCHARQGVVEGAMCRSVGVGAGVESVDEAVGCCCFAISSESKAGRRRCDSRVRRLGLLRGGRRLAGWLVEDASPAACVWRECVCAWSEWGSLGASTRKSQRKRFGHGLGVWCPSHRSPTAAERPAKPRHHLRCGIR